MGGGRTIIIIVFVAAGGGQPEVDLEACGGVVADEDFDELDGLSTAAGGDEARRRDGYYAYDEVDGHGLGGDGVEVGGVWDAVEVG